MPVLYAPRLGAKAMELRGYLAEGYRTLSGYSPSSRPEIIALLVADEDWKDAPRDNARPYPPGLPYFTRSVEPPALVLPEELSHRVQAKDRRHAAPYRLARAGPRLLARAGGREDPGLARGVRPAGRLGGDRPQGRSLAGRASVADRKGARVYGAELPWVRRGRGIRCRSRTCCCCSASAALEEFGEGFLRRIFHALWEEDEIVDEERAEELLADALGPGGREWLASRPEF